MDTSVENMEIDAIPEKLTIKVKLAQEDYHDLVIDMSDESDPFKGNQVIKQLSSITRIPLYYINLVWILYTAEDGVSMSYVENGKNNPNNDRITKKIQENINDGDCFAIETQMHYLDQRFKFTIILYRRGLFDENNCTFEYCQYFNTRPFLNRQIEIATNSELLMTVRTRMREVRGVVYQFGELMKIFSDLNIRHFTFNSATRFCRFRDNNRNYSEDLPHYSRARG